MSKHYIGPFGLGNASTGMKIIHMSLGNEQGGSTGVMLQLATGAREAGHCVEVSVFRDGTVAERAEELDLPVYRAGGGRLASIERMRRHLASMEPDAIHTHSYFPDIFGRPAARLCRVPVVVSTAHTNLHRAAGMSGKDRVPGRSLLVPWLSSVTNRFSQRFYATSSDVARSLLSAGVPESKVRLTLNEIDLRPFADGRKLDQARIDLRHELGLDTEDLVLGSVGRLESVKRFDLLLEGMRNAGPADRRLKLLLVGDGSERNRLEALRDKLGLNGQVLFTGWRKDVPRVLAAMDLYLVVSRMEGTPLALLEAMAAGLPCIATNVGGLPDVLPRPEIGFLIKPDSRDDLVRAMLELVDDPVLRTRMGKAARAHVLLHHNVELKQNLNMILDDLASLRQEAGGNR